MRMWKRPSSQSRLRERRSVGPSDARLLGREALREVVERRRAPGGLVAEELRLARAERPRARQRLAQAREALAREHDVDADAHPGAREALDCALGGLARVEAADARVGVARRRRSSR